MLRKGWLAQTVSRRCWSQLFPPHGEKVPVNNCMESLCLNESLRVRHFTLFHGCHIQFHAKPMLQATTNGQRSQQRSRHHHKVSWHQLCQHNIKRCQLFWYDSFAHHAAERNHAIVDGFHLGFLVLIWNHRKCDHGFVATKWSVPSRQCHLRLFRAVWAHNLQWDERS